MSTEFHESMNKAHPHGLRWRYDCLQAMRHSERDASMTAEGDRVRETEELLVTFEVEGKTSGIFVYSFYQSSS